MTTKHTPTPWYIEQCHPDEAFIVPDALAFDNRRRCPICKVVYGWQGEHDYIHDKENEANAAFIVRACNSHDELVKALDFYKTEAEMRGYKAVECKALTKAKEQA